MKLDALALKIGSQLIEAQLQKLAAANLMPEINNAYSSNSIPVGPEVSTGTLPVELPTTNAQKKTRSAKVHPPRIITVR